MDFVIEAYRGIAALMVMIHHYAYALSPEWQNRTEWLHFFHNGVDLFFVITGFLFAPYVLGEITVSKKAFLLRRFFRLYPLYIVSLLCYIMAKQSDLSTIIEASFRHLFFFQALPIFSLADSGFFSLVFWTLPVEVAFYMLVAICIYYWKTLAYNRDNQSRFLVLFGIISAVMFLLLCCYHRNDLDPDWVVRQAQLPSLLIEFWFGLILYKIQPITEKKNIWQYLIAAGIALFIFLMIHYTQTPLERISPRPFGLFSILSALDYAILIGGTFAFFKAYSITITTSKSIPLLVWIGSISYGTYLFHELMIRESNLIFFDSPEYIRVLAAVFMTILISYILHRIVEDPFRKYGRKIAEKFS